MIPTVKTSGVSLGKGSKFGRSLTRHFKQVKKGKVAQPVYLLVTNRTCNSHY
jgi:hypothetical protein